MTQEEIETVRQAHPAPVVGVAEHVVAVAEHILTRLGEMETERLQALVYLAQAWNLAMTGRPLFHEPIEAWPQGPVVPVLYELHAGHDTVAPGFFYEKIRARTAAESAPDLTR